MFRNMSAYIRGTRDGRSTVAREFWTRARGCDVASDRFVRAGAVIVEGPNGAIGRFDWLGDIVIALALVSLVLMWFVHKQVPEPAPR